MTTKLDNLDSMFAPDVSQQGYSGRADEFSDLVFEKIEQVDPLNSQIDVDVKKTAPDALFNILFKNDFLTNLSAGGVGKELGQPLHTYAILDAAKITNLPELLERSELDHRCLFKGSAYDELKETAPWIVKLDEDNSFTRHLFTMSDAPWHLWESAPGIYVRSPCGLDDMWRHFRKFTRLYNSADKTWRYFRFYDPLTLRALIKSKDENILGGLLKDAVLVGCQTQRNDGFIYVARKEEAPTQQAQTAVPRLESVLTDKASDCLTEERILNYKRNATAYLYKEFAPALRVLTDEEVQAVAHVAYVNARRRGIKSEREHFKYLVPVMFWGSHFETDPQYRGALQRAGWLDDHGNAVTGANFGSLFEEIDRWHEAVISDTETSRRLQHGFMRLYSDANLNASPVTVLESNKLLWPARCQQLSPSDHSTLVDASLDVAQLYGLKGADAVAYCCLAMYFGYRFVEDPRFPWAKAALSDTAQDDEERRLGLGSGVVKYWNGLLDRG